jgi:mono/diheme cytochrome c family protein
VKVPIVVKIGVLTVASTAFYTYVGQLVPQKEVQPPQETQIAADLTTADLVGIGKEIFDNKGMCLTCHTLGRSGALRFPDLGGIGSRAAQRVPGQSDIQYLAQSLYQPEAYIVPGFNPGMPVINRPPIGLTDDEIRAVIAYLQSLGGTANVTMQTPIPFAAGGAAAPAGEVVAEAAAAGAVDAAAASAAGTAPASGPRTADALIQQYQCASCHRLDAPGTLRAASLVDVGSRLNEDQIVGALAAHSPIPGGFESAVTVTELRALAQSLAARRGAAAASGATGAGAAAGGAER